MLDHEFPTDSTARHVLGYRKKILESCSEDILNETSQFWSHVVKIYYKRDFTVLDSCSEDSEGVL
jgi:hypothetical protein